MNLGKSPILNYSFSLAFIISSLAITMLEDQTAQICFLIVSVGAVVFMISNGTISFIINHLTSGSKYDIVRQLPPSRPTRQKQEDLEKSQSSISSGGGIKHLKDGERDDIKDSEPPSFSHARERTFLVTSRVQKQASEHNQQSLWRKAVDFTLNREATKSKKARQEGRSLHQIFEIYKDSNNVPKGQTRIHSHSRISAQHGIKFIPREYMEDQENPLKDKLLDRYDFTVQEFRLTNINLDDRYALVKKGVHKLLKKHNEQQASSLLFFAESIENFFQVKVLFQNPYVNGHDDRVLGQNLIQIDRQPKFGDLKGKDGKQNESDSLDSQGRLSYITLVNGVFRTVSYRQNPIQKKFNEIVKNATENPNKQFQSKVQVCYATVHFAQAMDEIFEYIRKQNIESPPWRYKNPEYKEWVFEAMKSIVATRKQLDTFIIGMNEKKINGKERITVLSKSAGIQKRLNDSFFEKKFPSALYEQRRLKEQVEIDKNTEKSFLFSFICASIKRNVKKYPQLVPSLTGPSIFNFGVSQYYLFYRETGYETGQPHYNLKYKYQNREQTVSCIPGKDNFYSAVYFYFFVLIEKHGRIISDNSDLRGLISELLPADAY